MANSRVMTEDEAISLTAHDTSAGYPFKFQGCVTKEQFFLHPDHHRLLQIDWMCCLQDDYVNQVIYDNIDKEEIRPLDKLEAGQHRSIMSPPVDHLITGQRLFADMNRRFVESHLLTSSAIGLSKTDGAWDRAIRKLAEFAQGFAGDEKAWDATLHAVVMSVCRDLRILALPSEKERIMHYYDVIINTLVRMPDGYVYRKRQGNPSGSVNTSYDNTIALFFVLAYCWILNCNDSYASFKRFVKALLYGDDNTFSVSPDYIEVYNLKTLGETMSLFGIVLKNPDDPPKPIAKLDFLSCTWQKMWGYWLPIMAPEKLMSGMYYSEYPTDPRMQYDILLSYYMTNPFNPQFIKYVFSRMEVLYEYMTSDEVYERKNALPTPGDMFKLYTGTEARHGKFNSASIFKNNPVRDLPSIVRYNQMSSSEPTHVMPTNTHSQSEVSLGKKVLNSPNLTEDARNWLIETLDPFHDQQIRCNGYPDIHTSGSVVQYVNQTINVVVPPGANYNWDCHLFNLQHHAVYGTTGTTNNSYQFNPSNGSFAAYGTQQYPGAGVVILTGAAGTQLLPNDSAPANTATVVQSLSPSNQLVAKCRVIGLGIEVINTTSELYKSGSVVCYRMPQVKQPFTYTTTFGTPNVPVCGNQFALPPTDVNHALLLPGAKQWNAAEGAYVVATQMSDSNPIQTIDNMPCFYAYDSLPPYNANTAGIGYMTALANGSSANFFTRMYMPFNTAGIYLSGLSNQSSLQINVKWIIEAFPGPNDTAVSFSQPSPSYCPAALELYSSLLNSLPVGVPFTQNPDGEWFSNVLGTIGSIAKAGTMIHPAFGLVGEGFGLGKKLYDSIRSQVSNQVEKKMVHPKHDPRSYPDVDYGPKQSHKQTKTVSVPKTIGLSKEQKKLLLKQVAVVKQHASQSKLKK